MFQIKIFNLYVIGPFPFPKKFKLLIHTLFFVVQKTIQSFSPLNPIFPTYTTPLFHPLSIAYSKTFIEWNGHHVHDDAHPEHETNT